MRDLRRQGIAWQVREMDATNVPGARGERCLIFDSEGLVRRAWSFPRGWAELDDDSVWALLDLELPPPRDRRLVRRDSIHREQTDVVDAARRAADTRRMATVATAIEDGDVIVADDAPHSHPDDAEINDAVAGFTAALKAAGTSPERAIVLVKRAVHDGLDQSPDCPDHAATELVDDAVASCIATYYAG